MLFGISIFLQDEEKSSIRVISVRAFRNAFRVVLVVLQEHGGCVCCALFVLCLLCVWCVCVFVVGVCSVRVDMCVSVA